MTRIASLWAICALFLAAPAGAADIKEVGSFHTRCREALAAQGGVADLIDPPVQGIRGNTHMMMMDRNSDQIAGLVQDWMARQGLMR